MSTLNFAEHPHRRLNQLTGEWMLVSPHRAKRPWQGKEEEKPGEQRPEYDPECYLCPGNARAGGAKNPDYEHTFVFTNDFSALKLETPSEKYKHDDLLIARGEPGICRVICFSPRHDLTLPEMELQDLENVVELWTSEYAQLGERPEITYVQIFENKGQIMGCSNPHPHGQIWAQGSIPVEPAKELRQQRQYLDVYGKCLLCEYIQVERSLEERLVVENDEFLVLVPFWAVWPFETLLVSKRHIESFSDLTLSEKTALADILQRITIKYDNVFEVSFPYSAGFHPAPTDGGMYPEWHFHMHFYPPLLRSATVKKFMVGYEMLANAQRDITAESAAKRLRELPEIHYTKS